MIRRPFMVNKGGLAGLVLLLLLGVLADSLLLSTQKSREQSQLMVAQSHESIDRLNDTLQLVMDAVVSQRGYIITGNQIFLAPYFRAVASVNNRIIELNASADPERRLLGEAIRAKLDRAAANISQRRRFGLEVVAREVSTMKGERLMSAVRLQHAKIVVSEQELLAGRMALGNEIQIHYSRVLFLVLAVAQLFSIVIVIMLLVQIARRRTAEEETQTLSGQLRNTLDNVGIGVALVDADAQIINRNDRLDALLNPGRNPADPVRLGGAELAGVRSREPLRLERVVGDDVVVEVNGQPAGHGLYVLTYTDVSARHQSDQLKNDFVSTVSHELRTPLTAIRGALGLVVGPLGSSIPGNVRQLLEIADRNAVRLTELVNDLLDVAQLESGRMTMDLRPVDLNLLASDAAEANGSLSARHSIRLAVGSMAEPVMVMADAGRLMQVITNLISNAVKFSPDDEIITIAVERRGALAWVSVHDQGAGIPAEFHSHIFGRFAQAASGDNKQVGGSGLGLHLSKAIVEQHGGDISFESRPGETKFCFSLPVLPIRQG